MNSTYPNIYLYRLMNSFDYFLKILQILQCVCVYEIKLLQIHDHNNCNKL